MVTDSWRVLAKIDTARLRRTAFDNSWEDRKADYCINTVNDSSTSDKNVVKFGPVTSEILWLLCMCTYRYNCARLRCFLRSPWTDVHQTFSIYGAGRELHNNILKL